MDEQRAQAVERAFLMGLRAGFQVSAQIVNKALLTPNIKFNTAAKIGRHARRADKMLRQQEERSSDDNSWHTQIA